MINSILGDDAFDFGDEASFLALMTEATGVMPAPMPTRGGYITAQVLSVGRQGAVVSYGGKSDALVAGKEMGKTLEVGKTALFAVLGTDDSDVVILSRRVVELWDELTAHWQNGTTIKVKVVGLARKEGRLAGLRVKHRDLPGFIPASMLGAVKGKVEDLVGTEMVVKVKDADRDERNLILDRRAVEQDERVLALKAGDVLQGAVTTVAVSNGREYGIFVDIGRAQGLVHVSEIPYSEAVLSERFARHDEVEVQVLSVEERRGKRLVSLSIKRPLQARFLNALKVGDVIEGTVVKRIDYGYFVSVCQELQVNGLLHTTQLPWAVRSQKREINEGDTVKVRISQLDLNRGRISLSMRDLPQE